MKSKEISEENETIIMNLYYSDETKNYTLNISDKRDENAVASAIYNKTYEKKGWDFLSISSYEKNDSKYSDSIKAYAMGYLEGYLTKDRIYNFYKNIINYNFFEEKTIPQNMLNFFQDNLDYMEKQSKNLMNSDSYWEQVHFILQQLKGLYDGYTFLAEENEKIDFIKFQYMPAYADSTMINTKYSNDIVNFSGMNKEEIENYILLKSHCSALVKLAEDSSDIWFGHNTWFEYIAMIRIFKEYRFISNKGNEKSKTSVFSSYPAVLFSLDDFYYLDSNLLIFETTLNVFNSSLTELISPKSLLTWVRVIVANRLASSGKEWTEIFIKENSGTYNNQFVILDMNKLKYEKNILKELEKETLMIIEQIPGDYETNDVTHLLKEGYYPSYNVPYSEKYYNITGYRYMVDVMKLNNTMSYKNSSRAKILKRDQGKIKTNKDFEKLMRYNNYQEDEFSFKSPSLAIASRGDLSMMCYGAIDVKYISIKELLLEKKNIVHIISGPSNDQQSTFSWSNTTCNIFNKDLWKHDGIVDTWNFPWIEYQVQLMKEYNNDEADGHQRNKNDKKKILIIIFSCIGSIIVIILIVVLIIYLIKRKSSKHLEEEVNKISFVGEDERNNEEY